MPVDAAPEDGDSPEAFVGLGVLAPGESHRARFAVAVVG